MAGTARATAGTATGSGGPAQGESREPERQRRTSRARQVAGWAAVIAPGLTVLLLDGYDLGTVSLWRDEAYTVDAAHRSLPQIVGLVQHTDAVNGTYYLLMHGVMGMAGTSTAALRLPSLVAMAVTATLLAVIGRRLARAMALPAPSLTGLLAGLMFAAAPLVTQYAQDARAYAIVAMLATIATYLLIRALEDSRWRWWVGYSLAVAAMGLFNLLSVLLLTAHGVTVVAVRVRRREPAGLPRWLAAAAAAAVLLSPLAALGYLQRSQVSWLHKPGSGAALALMNAFSGSAKLMPLIGFIALCGVAASFVGGRRVPLDVASVAVPWLVVPPAVLWALSQVHPLFDGRYVFFCLPALALLTAAGLSWIPGLVAAARPVVIVRVLAWLPPAVLVAALALLIAGPQRSVRLPGARPDDLRAVSAFLAAHERPGDAVFYLPANRRADSMGYPAPFQKLRDITLAKSPAAAGNLLGRPVTPPVLRERFASVQRVWVMSGRSQMPFLAPRTSIDKMEVALLQRMHLVLRWHTHRDMLSLYARG